VDQNLRATVSAVPAKRGAVARNAVATAPRSEAARRVDLEAAPRVAAAVTASLTRSLIAVVPNLPQSQLPSLIAREARRRLPVEKKLPSRMNAKVTVVAVRVPSHIAVVPRVAVAAIAAATVAAVVAVKASLVPGLAKIKLCLAPAHIAVSPRLSIMTTSTRRRARVARSMVISIVTRKAIRRATTPSLTVYLQLWGTTPMTLSKNS